MPKVHNPYGMTDHMFLFCQHYLSGFPRNQTRAYQAAYPKCKTEKSAGKAASRLMINPKVKAYINEQEQKIHDNLERQYIASTESVLKEEGLLAHSSIKSLFNPDGTFIAPHELPDAVAKMISSVKPIGIKIGTDKDGNPKIREGFEYKFWDKGAALNRLEKCFGMHIEKHEHGLDDDLKSLLESIDGRHRGKLPSEIEEDD